MSKKVIFTDYKDKLLNSYLKDISKYKVLDNSEVAILISKAQAGDKIAREQVITSNLRFVVTIAKQFQNRGLPLTNMYSQQHSRTPSPEELSEMTGIDVADINFLSQFSNKIMSIDDFVGDEENGNQLSDIIPNNEPLLDDQINKKLVFDNLDVMLNTLTDREHDLIRMLFGIDIEPVDTDTVADMYGVGKERIRQMKEAALDKLKNKFSNQLKGLVQ